MDHRNDVSEELIDLGVATEQTRGIPVGRDSDDSLAHKTPLGLSAE